MEQKQYKVIFSGGSVPSHDIERVKNNLANLFNKNSSQLDVLFQDRLVVIKKNIDLTAADLFRESVERIGGYCIIEAMQETAEQSVLNLTAKSEKMVCPKCQSVQQKVPVCSACGVLVDEFRQKISENQAAVFASMKTPGSMKPAANRDGLLDARVDRIADQADSLAPKTNRT